MVTKKFFAGISAFLGAVLLLSACGPVSRIVGVSVSNVAADSSNNAATNTIGNTPGNIVNVGFVVDQGNWIYYAGNDGLGLYKVKTEGSGRQELSNNRASSIESINIVENKIFYLADNVIYAINTDGTGEQKLCDDGALRMAVVDGWVYYNSAVDYKIYAVKTDGSGSRKVSDDMALYFEIVGGWIYYNTGDLSTNTDNLTLCRMHTDGSAKQELDSMGRGLFDVSGDEIYYIGETAYNDSGDSSISINSIRTDGTDKQKVCDCDSVIGFIVTGDKIYYSGTDGIYAVNSDGNDKQQLLTFSSNVTDYISYFINIVNNRIYYVDGLKLYSTKLDGSDKQTVG